MDMATTALLARNLGGTILAETPIGNAVLIGLSLVGLLGAGALIGTARLIRDERRDPLNDRHYLNF
ncbi:MAG: hypothetical protein JWP66_1757 [Naasia sp.]|nr:hypothetical protein [Naasia sp.]